MFALALLGVVPLSPAGASPPDDVEAAREAVDRVADRWFTTQAEADRLDAEITQTEQQLAAIERRASTVRDAARDRALAIYKGSSASFVTVLGSDDALESLRRVELIDRANEGSGELFDELEDLRVSLAAKKDALEASRAEHEKLLAEIGAEREHLETALADAVAAQQRAEAQQAAAARAATSEHSREGVADATPARSTAPPVADPGGAGDAVPAPSTPAGGVHPQHDNPFLVCTRNRESGGNYGAVSPAGYYGAYQFAQLTWDSTANHAGRGDLIGVRPSQASVYDQDDMAWTLYSWQGDGPWGGRC